MRRPNSTTLLTRGCGCVSATSWKTCRHVQAAAAAMQCVAAGGSSRLLRELPRGRGVACDQCSAATASTSACATAATLRAEQPCKLSSPACSNAHLERLHAHKRALNGRRRAGPRRVQQLPAAVQLLQRGGVCACVERTERAKCGCAGVNSRRLQQMQQQRRERTACSARKRAHLRRRRPPPAAPRRC